MYGFIGFSHAYTLNHQRSSISTMPCHGGYNFSYRGALWRNGSASDSRSEGCVFKSRQGHSYLIENVKRNISHYLLIEMFISIGKVSAILKENSKTKIFITWTLWMPFVVCYVKVAETVNIQTDSLPTI